MKKQILFLIPVMMLLLVSCMNQGNSNDSKDEKVPAIKSFLHDLDKKAVTHVDNVIDHYLHIQHALVNSDSTEAKAGAAMVLGEMKNFDTLILSGNARQEYNRFASVIVKSTDSIGKGGGLPLQRLAFKSLSNGVYGLAKAFGYKKTLYKVHCPMAFNHQGADWLSTENEVKNPYYGKDMLECGTVEEAIKK